MYGQQQNNYGGFAQQPPQAAQPVSLSLDSVMQGGTPNAFSKDDPIGTTVTGEVTSIEAQQQTDFTTGEPLFYPNGNPKPQIVIHVKTQSRDQSRDYDDGLRTVYVKGYNLKHLKAAAQRAGVGDYPRVGDTLTATFATTQPAKQRGYNDAKIYEYQVTPGNPGKAALDAAMSGVQAAPTTVPAQPAPPTHGVQSGAQAVQVGQLAALGKTPADIAALTGLDVRQVTQILGMQADTEQEPAF